ncbi:MAG: N-acetylglucosamine-6-phosphate deacetylase [Pseudomonadota bacterium]
MSTVIDDIACIYAKLCFDGEAWQERVTIHCEVGHISAIEKDSTPPKSAHIIPDDHILTPGLIDIQVNGGGGILWNDLPNRDNLQILCNAHATLGTAWVLPTLISPHRATIKHAIATIKQAVDEKMPGVLGLHIEGPFLHLEKSGIHPKTRIATLCDSDLELLCTLPKPAVTMVTLAPECVTQSQLDHLITHGVIAMAGHSMIAADQATTAFNSGVRGTTHLYNAMPGLSARAPGLIGATLSHPQAYASLICDRHHCHTAAVQLAHRAKGPDHLLLISDAMPSVGSDCQSFSIAHQTITLHDGRLQNADGTLGGAHLHLAQAIANFAEICACDLGEAIRLATRNVGMLLRTPHLGAIKKGARARFSQLLDIRSHYEH